MQIRPLPNTKYGNLPRLAGADTADATDVTDTTEVFVACGRSARLRRVFHVLDSV